LSNIARLRVIKKSRHNLRIAKMTNTESEELSSGDALKPVPLREPSFENVRLVTVEHGPVLE
jgi:hypothetical protein